MSSNLETQTITPLDATSNGSDVKDLLQTLLDDSANLQTLYKTWNVTLKKLAKEMDREQKKLHKAKPKRKVVQKPQEVTPDMQAFMKKHAADFEVSTSYTRQVMMKAVSNYIKTANLQNVENKKQWARDKTLTSLFKLEKDWYTFMQINGILSRVVLPLKTD